MKKLTFAAVVLVAVTTGCGGTYYHARLPVLEVPERPRLENIPAVEMKKMSPEAQKAVGDNFNKLIDYGRKYEVTVRDYNKYAEEQNKILNTGM